MNAVAYCIDRNYFEPLKVSLFSLLSHSRAALQIHIVCEDLSEAEQEELTALVGKFEPSRISFHNPIRRHLENVPIHLHFSKANFDRLYLPEILNQLDAPILYLDADTIIRADAQDLFDSFDPQFPLGACQDYLGTISNPATRVENPQQYGVEPTAKYFNSGLLLIQPKIWREKNLSSLLANFCRDHPETLFLADQSAMNIVFQNKVQFLPSEWNVQTVHPNILNGTWDLPYVPQDHTKAKMIHFTTELKPWTLGKDLPEAKFFFEAKQQLLQA